MSVAQSKAAANFCLLQFPTSRDSGIMNYQGNKSRDGNERMTEDARNHEGCGTSPKREKSRPSETNELNLFLDDWRQQPPSFILAKTYEECILLLQEFDINILSLDYHLGEVFTGYDVAVWIVEHGKWPKEVYFHTSDPVGQRRMYDLLAARAPESTRVTNGRYQSVDFTE